MNAANSAFYGQLNRAQNTSYTNINAINNISHITQDMANTYAYNGIMQAMQVSMNYGCAPGSTMVPAIGTFLSNIQTSKDSVNQQISAVKENKTSQYHRYQAWLKEQARLQKIAQEAQRKQNTNQGMMVLGSKISNTGTWRNSLLNPKSLADMIADRSTEVDWSKIKEITDFRPAPGTIDWSASAKSYYGEEVWNSIHAIDIEWEREMAVAQLRAENPPRSYLSGEPIPLEDVTILNFQISDGYVTKTNSSISARGPTITEETYIGLFSNNAGLSLGYVELMHRGQWNQVADSDNPSKTLVGGFGKASAINYWFQNRLGPENVGISQKCVIDLGVVTSQAGLQYKEGSGVAIGGKASVASARGTYVIDFYGWQIEVGMDVDFLAGRKEFAIGELPDGGFGSKGGVASYGIFGIGYLIRITKPG